MDYEVIICFETHVELNTRTKLFCDCATSLDAPPNTRICPVCTGQPGALPVLNKKAVELAVRAGLALDCTIHQKSRFARKNYFYPDLPKGYQISQYERPFCEDGRLEITGDDGRPYAVGIKRIHLEEDAGKLVHEGGSFETSKHSLVDFNRACMPLLEIVADHTRNPLRSPNEARAYLEKLIQILRFISVSDCLIEKGQFRCDVNVSLRPRGGRSFGNRAEIKNMASIRFIEQALEYEIKRQAEILSSGGEVDQETRLFVEDKRITLPMRSKEDAPDYRYFPDPDLMEVDLDPSWIHEIRTSMPELPDHKRRRLMSEFQIPRQEALVLTRDPKVSVFFERCALLCDDHKRLGRWITRDLFRLLKEGGTSMEDCPIGAEDFSRLIDMVSKGHITDHLAALVLEEMFKTGRDAAAIIEAQNLRPIEDENALNDVLEEVFSENPGVVSKIRDGEARPVGFLIGQVMKKSEGRADPKKVKDLILKKLMKADAP